MAIFDRSTLQIHGLSAALQTWKSEVSTQSTHDGTAMGLTPIHFAHANGIPAGSYSSLLGYLADQTQRTVYALDHRATWVDAPAAPKPSFSWGHAAGDLIAAIEKVAPQGVIGIGHSLGAVVTLLAAYKRPDLFKQIILIEPILFPTRTFLSLAWMPISWRLKFFPLVKRTMRRKDIWNSHSEFLDYHVPKRAFKGIPLSVMNDYAEHGLRADREQFKLAFPKAWEALVFSSVPYAWHAVKRVKVPCIGARAGNSNWVPKLSWQKWAQLRPDHPIHILPNLDHLAPLQAPQDVGDWLISVLKP